jgi:hypothetical protein
MDDRMFHVLVLGGMALVGCGGAGASHPIPDDAAAADGSGGEAFPSEAHAGAVDASARVDAPPDPAAASPDPADASLGIVSVDSADSAASDAPYIFPMEAPR